MKTALLLGAGTVALFWTDRVVPLPPPQVAAWIAVGPMMALFDAVRVGLFVAAAYLVLLSTVIGLARLFHWRRVLAAIRRTPGGGRVVKFFLGTAVAGASLAAGAIPAGANPPPGPAPVLYWVAPAPSHSVHHVTRHRPPARPAVRTGHTWTVRPGDDLWSIAHATLRTHLGRDPNQREIARYWLVVIAKNRDRLPDPSDPSLLFPGDVVVLPSPGEPLPVAARI